MKSSIILLWLTFYEIYLNDGTPKNDSFFKCRFLLQDCNMPLSVYPEFSLRLALEDALISPRVLNMRHLRKRCSALVCV